MTSFQTEAPVLNSSALPSSTPQNEILRATKFPGEFTAGARNAVSTCLRVSREKVTLITDERACIAASMAVELDRSAARGTGSCWKRSPPARWWTCRPCSRYGEFPGRSSPSRFSPRNCTPHADDRRRQPPPHAPRPHGQHHPRDMTRGCEPISSPLTACRRPCSKGPRRDLIRATTRRAPTFMRNLLPSIAGSKPPELSDQKWRNLAGGECFSAGRGQRRLCGRWSGRRLSVRALWHFAARHPLTIDIEGNRIARAVLRQ